MSASARTSLLTIDSAARRRRARRFWGAVGAMMRFDERRVELAYARKAMAPVDPRAKRAA